MIYTAHYDSPLGGMTMACDGIALVGLWFDGQKYFGAPDGAEENADIPVFRKTRNWLDVYFSGENPGFVPQLSLNGSPFRRAVWDRLLGIPYGSTVTYGAIAEELGRRYGRRMSAQAVGGAVGHNPVSLIVPCHRVVGSDGSLTGYAGGVDKKLRLLALEGADVSALKMPDM